MTKSVIYSDGLYVDGRHALLNGRPLPLLRKPAKCITHINGKVFIDGYEYKYGKWRRTLRAFWHLLF